MSIVLYRLGTERVLSTPVEPLNLLKGLPTPLPALSGRASENSDPSERAACCPLCLENYEKEVAKLTTIHKSFSEATSEPSLPQWLQNAKLNTSDASQVCFCSTVELENFNLELKREIHLFFLNMFTG